MNKHSTNHSRFTGLTGISSLEDVGMLKICVVMVFVGNWRSFYQALSHGDTVTWVHSQFSFFPQSCIYCSLFAFYTSERTSYFMFVSLNPAGDWHQPRFMSCDRPNPKRSLWLAGGGHPVGLLSGHQHSGHVDLASPAECQRLCHLTVLPCTSSSHVSVYKLMLQFNILQL